MPEPSPGQRAYDAYTAALPLTFPRPWDDVSPTMQAAWDAAAEAVREVEPPATLDLLYVVVMQEGTQIQLCGAYPNAEEAGIHLAHARTIMPERHLDIRVCPFALTGQAHRQEATDHA